MGLYVFNWPISVLGDLKDISIAHVIIITKSEVSIFPIVIIFFETKSPRHIFWQTTLSNPPIVRKGLRFYSNTAGMCNQYSNLQ